MTAPRKRSFLYRNSLTIVFVALTLLTICGQVYTGWKEHNKDLSQEGAAALPLSGYLASGHFFEAIFENWESEFLQMGMYVVFTIWLRQEGSSESKKIDEEEEVDREPVPHKDAPYPVKKGGLLLKLYQNSLSLAFFTLFIISFFLHAMGSLKDENISNKLKGLPQEEFSTYLLSSRLWFESFQNWQSEFLSVASIVFLSIYLRQKGSPESKPVDAPNSETGK